MLEKILQKLKEQRGNTSNVSDRTLKDLARSLVSVITTDELLENADFADAIESMDGNINKYTADAVKNATKEKKDEPKKDEPKKEGPEKDKKSETDEAPSWAKSLMDANRLLAERLDALSEDKTKTTRKTKLLGILKTEDGTELPDWYKKPILDGFTNASFKDDDAYDEYLAGIKDNVLDFQQKTKESGVDFSIPKKDADIPEETGETSTLAEARKVVKAQEDSKKE